MVIKFYSYDKTNQLIIITYLYYHTILKITDLLDIEGQTTQDSTVFP